MLEPKSFAGGLHPPEMKLTSDKAIKNLPLPDRVVLHVSQHIGAPAKPSHKITDKVSCGEVVAEAGGYVSAPIHATISGSVIAVGNFMHPFGVPSPAIVIERDPAVAEPPFTSENGLELSVAEIKKRIQDSGMVGLGGATFPTHVKLSPPDTKPIDTVILNGVECEPALTSDHRLMLEETDKVINGLQLIMKALNAKNGIIGVENNKPDAIKALDDKLKALPNITVQPLKVKYPQGGEKQLIYACLGREIPSGSLPMDVGVVVQNVASAAAIADAVNMKRPLLERIVTLAGNCVANPGNYRVRIGTTVCDFIEMTGGLKKDVPLKKVIMGGPMMGFALFDLHIPIIKGTSGVLCWDSEEAAQPHETSCLRCGSCIRACPMGLMPQKMKQLIDHRKWDKVDEIGMLDCIECGCCAYACPSALPLVQSFKLGKKNVMAERKKAPANKG
ncbi:MAG: electron transport complex subunit RsxC [Candidatus Riflebacteria bacterium HGW-Riflebacteria-1]|jgi:electron transport complex protein RnfC|nr:MAG: electron transport complex subunit RsxC [Candidatus Riflebacteria bacterium HGW-Riflebacteria-1]